MSASNQVVQVVPIEKLLIVTDKAHPLYDERVNMTLDPKLVENVKAFGVLEPILITPAGDNGISLVIAGRQRLRAAIKAGLKAVPCIFKDEKIDGVMYTENAARRDDDPLTKMRNIQHYIEAHKAEKDAKAQASVVFCCSLQSVDNALRVLSCDKKVIESVERGEITTTAALQLYKLKPAEQVEKASKLVAESKATGKRATVTKANAAAGGKKGQGRARAGAGDMRRKDEVVKLLTSTIKEWNDMSADQQARDLNNARGVIDVLGWMLHDETEIDEKATDALKAKGSKKIVYLIPESCQ